MLDEVDLIRQGDDVLFGHPFVYLRLIFANVARLFSAILKNYHKVRSCRCIEITMQFELLRVHQALQRRFQ